MRSFTITVIHAQQETVLGDWALPVDELSEGWMTWLEATDKSVKQFVTCEFDVAEEVIGWVAFGDGSHKVVIQEALRPEEHIYAGLSAHTAETLFWEQITKHARHM